MVINQMQLNYNSEKPKSCTDELLNQGANYKVSKSQRENSDIKKYLRDYLRKRHEKPYQLHLTV